MSSAVYKTRVKYINAFRVGYDNIPKWFIDTVEHMRTVSIVTINEDGLFSDSNKLANYGDYVIEDNENFYGFIACPQEEFEKEYEVQEYLNKDECINKKHAVIPNL